MEHACSSKRRLRSNSGTKLVEYDNLPKDSSEGEGASFIKLLDRDFSKQLQIPQEFTETFNGNVPRRFLIESTMTKTCWRVEVKEEDDKIYLHEGWAGFVEGHPLQVGDFLLFEHEEHSIFVVKIYDKNGCRKMARDVPGGKNNPVKVVNFEEQQDSEAKNYKPKKLIARRSGQGYMKRLITRKYGKAKYKKHAIQRNRVKTASVSENNMAFSVTMHNVKHQFRELLFPQAITHAQKLRNKKEVILGNDAVNRWPVGFSHRKDGRVALCRGWPVFLEDNRITAGDSLSFEFVTNDLVKVHVTKGSQAQQEFEEDNSPSETTLAQNMDCKTKLYRKQVNPSKPATAAIRVSENKKAVDVNKKKRPISRERVKAVRVSENNKAFYVMIHKYKKHQFAQQVIPVAIIRAQNLMNKKEVILEDTMGNRWPVELSHCRKGLNTGHASLCHGWKAFLDGNGVAAGDSLSFEFVSEDVVKVRVTKESQVEEEIEDDHDSLNDTTMDCESDEINAFTDDVNPRDTPIITRRGRKRNSPEPSSSSFSCLWPATLGYLYIPNIVTRGQNLKNKDSIVLRDPDGKSWPVELCKHRTGVVSLQKGWTDFWKGQSIKVGESMDFEFVSEDVVQVKINRGKPLKSPIKTEETIINLSDTSSDELRIEPETSMTRAEMDVTCNYYFT